MKIITSFLQTIVLLTIVQTVLTAQTDTIKYQWPVPPFNSSQPLSATFCEFRNTGSADHFHDAVDIAEPDGYPVYSGLDGVVDYIGNSGSNSYVTVRTPVGNTYKRILYLHIVPNPNISVGQSVQKGVTVLGSIYTGMGHVHMTEKELGSSGIDINPIRPEGGLYPYHDTYSPIVHSSGLQFRVNGTSKVLSSTSLTGKVDIIVKIEESNGSSSIYQNNGTYIAGYRIWSADTTTIVYEPDDAGMKFKFDRQPSNSYVHNVFLKGVATLSNPIYILTNGAGASIVDQSNVVSDNYWDTDLLAEGNYILEIFAEDTRENTAQKFFPVTIAKDPPILLSVINHNNQDGVSFSWEEFPSPTLKGYKIYYSNDLTNWGVAADETMATSDSTSISFNSQADFLQPVNEEVYYFKITAVDSSGNESRESDIYSRSVVNDAANVKKVLIVDGFDKYGVGAGWSEPSHKFNTTYFNGINNNIGFAVSSCANDVVKEQAIQLNDYDIVVWFTGDESRAEQTLRTSEQAELAAYLENGGNLFITGNDIGYDLDNHHGYSEFTDTLFYRHYLNARFEHTGAPLDNKLLTGVSGGLFEGVSITFGGVYPEISPDDIIPNNGAVPILNYQYKRPDNVTDRVAGLVYTGTFGDSEIEGKVVYLSFALETVESEDEIFQLISKVLSYFYTITDVKDNSNLVAPDKFTLDQNYPNPFNPSTTIGFNIPEQSKVSLKIFDLLGREVATLVNEVKSAGKHIVNWNAKNFSSGVYFSVLKTNEKTLTKSMLLLK